MRIDEKGHFYCTCEVCGSETRFGPDLYQGRVCTAPILLDDEME